MSKTKINIAKTITGLTHDAEVLATNLGIMALAATTVVGMTELATHQDVKVLATQRPAYAVAGDHGMNQTLSDMTMRKEREEIGHDSVSYGVTMRSHAIAGKR